jgi:hypothetical protein
MEGESASFVQSRFIPQLKRELANCTAKLLMQSVPCPVWQHPRLIHRKSASVNLHRRVLGFSAPSAARQDALRLRAERRFMLAGQPTAAASSKPKASPAISRRDTVCLLSRRIRRPPHKLSHLRTRRHELLGGFCRDLIARARQCDLDLCEHDAWRRRENYDAV